MKIEGQEKTAEECEPGLSHPPDNESASPSDHGFKVLETERSGAGRSAKKKASSTSLARRATGPRTPQGKARSKYNAIKYGIFSKVILVKGEHRAQYDALLKGLREYFQPVGTVEGVLVEKLAVLLWRHRRLIVAEGAEIRNSSEFWEWDEGNREYKESEEIRTSFMLERDRGLMSKIDNPIVLERCLELLVELRVIMEAYGFEPNWENPRLEKLYGVRDEGGSWHTLYDSYFRWGGVANIPEEDRQDKGSPTPEQCKRNVSDEIDAEIRRLTLYKKTRARIEADRTKLEMLRRSVPDPPGLDRLLRYEAHLERIFDRTLSQLERLQRMRLGQPVLPPIKVQLSG
jgi:hypothetical protein